MKFFWEVSKVVARVRGPACGLGKLRLANSGGGGLVSVNRSRRGKPLLNFGMFVIHSFFLCSI